MIGDKVRSFGWVAVVLGSVVAAVAVLLAPFEGAVANASSWVPGGIGVSAVVSTVEDIPAEFVSALTPMANALISMLPTAVALALIPFGAILIWTLVRRVTGR